MRILGGEPAKTGAGRPFETLRLLQSSMQVDDKLPAVRHDAEQVFEYAVSTGVDVVHFTESARGSRPYEVLRAEADARGWLFSGRGGDSHFALNPKNRLVEAGFVLVVPGQGGMPKGNHPDLGIAELTFVTPLGNTVTVHGGHWLTGYQLDRHPGPENRREARFTEQTKAMIERVQLHGAGRRLAFWMGDTNLDEQRDTGADTDAIHARFKAAGLRSIYDELRGPGAQLPSTHGGPHGSTLDVIGSYRLDGRVRAQRVRVLPRNGRQSDHAMVLGVYRIELPR